MKQGHGHEQTHHDIHPKNLTLWAGLSLGLMLPLTALADRTVSYTYTVHGQVETIDGPRVDVTDVTTYGYDENGNRNSITNALNQTTQITAHDASGRPLTIVSPNGLTTTRSYDLRGRMIQQTVSDGTTSRTTDYDYDGVGNLIQVTLPDGNSISYDYDAAHRLTGLEDQLGNRIDYTLDDMGNRLSEEVSDPTGTLTRTKQQVYDQLSQLDQSIDSENHTTDFDYDPNGNLTRTLDANLNPTAQTYDPLNRLSQTTDAKNGITQYSYDTQDNLTQVTDPTGLVTSYEYDALGNLITLTSPDTGVTTYTYDEAGNRLTETDARNVTTSYSYDALNRLTNIIYPDTSLNISYTYDQGTYGIGQLTQMSDAEGTTDYQYNAFGELTQVTRTSQDGVTTSFTYGYNPQGQLASQSYPSGYIVHYSYAQGQLTGLSLEKPDGTTQSLVSQIQRLPFGPINALAFGNGLQLSRTFDQDYQLIAQTLSGVLDDSYGHDPVGNIIDWQDLLQNARDQSFDYDELDRLTSATGAYGNLGYSYDAIGNRLSKTEDSVSESYTYAAESHRLLEILGTTTDTRQYDEAGNTIDSLLGSYTYDDQNRMVGFTKTGTTASYGYNGKGERVRKTVDGVTTRFRYGPSGALLGEYDQSGQAIREYVYLEGQPVAQLTGYTAPAQIVQSVRANHNALTVDLGQHPTAPVVIASPLTLNGTQGAVAALSDVQSSQVSVQTKEWDYLDGGHALEDISVLALPPGLYPQTDGSVWEVGRFSVSGTRHWHSVSFDSTFETTPYLFLTQQTQNDPEVTVVRVRNLTASGFEAALYEQESLNDGHGAETVGYVAIHSPTGSGSASFYDTSFNYQLSQRSLKQEGATEGGQLIKLQEEQSNDTELAHAYESVDILQLEGHTFAQAVSFAGADSFTLRRVGATSSAVVSGIPETSLVYLHTDHLGAVVKATDEQGSVVWDVDRKPFGERMETVAVVEMLLGFPGQYFDQETNNYYNYFRDYDPTIGRYLQSDPIGLWGGANTYGYANSNSLTNIDLKGLFWGPNPPSGPSPNPNPTPNSPIFPGSSCGPAGSPNNFPNGMFGDWNFEPACQYHDQCYGHCGADKGYCDRAFRDIMTWECDKLGDMISRQTCRNMANAYYQAVDRFGDDPYKNAQSGCQCKP